MKTGLLGQNMCLNFLDLESNFSKKVGEWEKILAYYNDYVDDDEVWRLLENQNKSLYWQTFIRRFC